MADNMDKETTTSRNDVLLQSRTRTQSNQETTTCSDNNVNDDLSTNVAAAAASMDTDTNVEQQEMYSQVSQQTETTHSCFEPYMCTLEETLIYAKQINDGQVPPALQHLAATKVDNSDSDSDMDNVVESGMDNVTKQDKRAHTGIDRNEHDEHMLLATVDNGERSEAEQCLLLSTVAIQHQQLQDAATMPTVTMSSCPPRPLALPALAEDSVRPHYKFRATANSTVNLLSQQQSNDVNNARPAQAEDLMVAVPVEEDETRVYAVRHDVSQHELYKQVQMVRVRRHSCRLYFVVFLLVAAAAMITSIVLIKNNKSDGQEQESETELTWLQNMIRNNPQGQLIVSIMGADAVLLNDASSPYAKALAWLLQSNESNESQEMTSTLAQRFYLASLYYDTTTDDAKWAVCNPPTNSSSEHDQICYGSLYDDTYQIINNHFAQAWLSDSHECLWAGVTCDKHQQITSLELYNMSLVGTIPSSTAKLPFLQELVLSSSRLEGNISLLSCFHHLTYIVLNDNLLSGDFSSVWQNRKLKVFYASTNHFTGSLSSQVGNLVDVKWLSLGYNNLTGTVPNDVGRLDSITSFDIADNHFRGKLPQFMQSWSMIITIDVSGNSFSGSIPTFLGQFNTTLLYLHLFNNKFTGTLPDELFHLSKLYALDVSNNELHGTLDARVAQLTNSQWYESIVTLDLSYNHFTGTIPTELGLLFDLFKIYLQGNDFTGTVPAIVFKNDVYDRFEFFADCAKDNKGQVELQCDCCTSCCQTDGTHCQLK